MVDPINDPENSDWSEVECCHWCHQPIEPGTEREGNGWFWHINCIPLDLVEGRMVELRDAERAGK